jgi:hypothetical protein
MVEAGVGTVARRDRVVACHRRVVNHRLRRRQLVALRIERRTLLARFRQVSDLGECVLNYRAFATTDRRLALL